MWKCNVYKIFVKGNGGSLKVSYFIYYSDMYYKMYIIKYFSQYTSVWLICHFIQYNETSVSGLITQAKVKIIRVQHKF